VRDACEELILINAAHLRLFSELCYKVRISIRESNPDIERWKELKGLGLCSILKTGRSGTVVIHATAKSDEIAETFINIIAAEP
jgi:hypothetical protein